MNEYVEPNNKSLNEQKGPEKDMALIKTVRLIITLTAKAHKSFMNPYLKQYVVCVIAMRSVKTGAKKSTLIFKKEAKNSDFKQKIINFQRF